MELHTTWCEVLFRVRPALLYLKCILFLLLLDTFDCFEREKAGFSCLSWGEVGDFSRHCGEIYFEEAAVSPNLALSWA